MIKKHNILKDILCNITETITSEIACVKEIINVSNNVYIKLKSPFLKECSKSFNYILNYSKNNHNQDIPCDKKTESVNESISTYEFCKKCQMKFISKDLLSQHVKMTHKDKNNAVICEFCGKDCKKPSTLKVHLNCHKEKACPHCSKILKSHSHFKVHVKNHEVRSRRPNLRRSQYSCNICPFKSLNKNSLDAHVNKIHLQVRPFACEICNKAFFKKSNLTEHLIIHNRVKNLTCEQCGDCFATKKTLVEHLRLHSGDKPFQCEICSLSFVTSGRRSDHFKRKHLEKTICCFVCDKKFSLKKELNSHMKKMHTEKESDGRLQILEPNALFAQNYIDGKEFVKL